MTVEVTVRLAKISPRARELYLLAGEIARKMLDDRQYEAVDQLLALRGTELAFTSMLVAHSLIMMDEADLMGEMAQDLYSILKEDES